MTALEHSPLPWRFDVRAGVIRDANGNIVHADLEPNARLITAAVNAHAELLAAARKAVDIFDEERFAIVAQSTIDNCIDKLLAAIAKAEEAES